MAVGSVLYSSLLDCIIFFKRGVCEIANVRRVSRIYTNERRDVPGPNVALLILLVHITPILQNLHCLPVNIHIAYKINLLTYKSNAGLSPTYLSDLLHDYVPSRTLRSSSQSLLQLPRRIPSKSYGQKSFFNAAPALWNNLPQQIRTADNVKICKSLLKTHLFHAVYS